MPFFEVTRSYTSCDIYRVEAENEADAYRKAKRGEGHIKTYDGDYDDAVDIVRINLDQSPKP